MGSPDITVQLSLEDVAVAMVSAVIQKRAAAWRGTRPFKPTPKLLFALADDARRWLCDSQKYDGVSPANDYQDEKVYETLARIWL